MARRQSKKSESDLLKERTLRFTADGDYSRLDVYLNERLDNLSRTHIKKIIKKGVTTINGESARPSASVKQGDEIVVVVPPPEPLDIQAEDIPLDVLFEDADLIVLNKQKNLTVHPTPNCTSGTLVNALLSHCGDSLSGIGGVMRPGIVHRLDKETSGVIIVAKNDNAHVVLSDQMKERRINKRYTAFVHGTLMMLEGEIDLPIGRNPGNRKKMAVVEKGGKDAITGYSVVEAFKHFSHLDLKLYTGRTHQIRVHLSHLGHPVAGDPVYGGRKFKGSEKSVSKRELVQQALSRLDGQALHAREISFRHPMTSEPINIVAPLPADIQKFYDFLNEPENARE